MSDEKKASFIYLAYINGNNTRALIEVSNMVAAIFAQKKVSITTNYVSEGYSVILISSNEEIPSFLITSFEVKVHSYREAVVLFSYTSVQPVYLFSLYLSYSFDELKRPLVGDNFRRSLTSVYDLTSARVAVFNQNSTATSLVLTSSVQIPNKDIVDLLMLTNVDQVTMAIPFQNF